MANPPASIALRVDRVAEQESQRFGMYGGTEQVAEALLADLRAQGFRNVSTDRNTDEQVGVDRNGIRHRDLSGNDEESGVVECSELGIVGPTPNGLDTQVSEDLGDLVQNGAPHEHRDGRARRLGCFGSPAPDSGSRFASFFADGRADSDGLFFVSLEVSLASAASACGLATGKVDRARRFRCCRIRCSWEAGSLPGADRRSEPA